MPTKMPAGATEEELSGRAYVHLHRLLGLARLPISKHFNAKYDLFAVLGVLIAMCESSLFVTPAIASLARHARASGGDDGARSVPSPRWFTKLVSSVAAKTMLSRAARMFARSVEMMAERGMIPRSAVVAIDLTQHPYHGKKADEIARGGPSKGGGGTTRFETYATAVIASLSYLPHVWVGPVHKGDALCECVKGALLACRGIGVSARLLLLDRGFYSAAVMLMADRMYAVFIMPVPKQAPIRRAIDEFKRGKRGAVSKHKLNAKKGSKGKMYEYTMVIVKRFKTTDGKREAVYLVFATNMPLDDAADMLASIPTEYKKRWAIETGYRTVNETRARTKSNSVSMRLFLFYFTLTSLNVWAMVNYEADTERTRAGLLKRARTKKERRAAARARGRGPKKRKWQLNWRNVVTRNALFDWLRIAADKMFLLSAAAGRADLLARMAAAAT